MTIPPPNIAPRPDNRFDQARAITLRWLISTLAIFAAIYLVPGIYFTGPGWQIGIIALLFGLINALLRPILTLLTCPLVVLTLGLFGLVINALLLLLTAQIAAAAGVQLTIDGFWPAFFGGLVISLVSLLLGVLAGEVPLRVYVRDQE
ncbi:MAG TPA: phage holin family protein [Roseiflexaceae bacterium]|nr:phage holin family protein [Roseiflexaceae bacterium]HMP40766.1 phage holin family protein [Roseiflexaceae bacterium]